MNPTYSARQRALGFATMRLHADDPRLRQRLRVASIGTCRYELYERGAGQLPADQDGPVSGSVVLAGRAAHHMSSHALDMMRLTMARATCVNALTDSNLITILIGARGVDADGLGER